LQGAADRFTHCPWPQAEPGRPPPPAYSFGWGYATVSLRTKKIKGLHENDFIIAAKLDRIAASLPA
jgi:Pterin 4 alpha carbinolamine dehydratase